MFRSCQLSFDILAAKLHIFFITDIQKCRINFFLRRNEALKDLNIVKTSVLLLNVMHQNTIFATQIIKT